MSKLGLARFVPHVGRIGRASRWRRSKGRPRVWAHRGASAHAPENTMVAFERARDDGADGIELDVRLDAYRNVVVFHDLELERLTGQPGRIDQCSASARDALRVGGERIPLLAEVLHSFDLEINVEIKTPDRRRGVGELVERVAKVIADSGRAEQILVSAFDPVALVQFHRYHPDLALAYLFHETQALPLRRGWAGRWCGVSVMHPEHSLCTARTVDAWHRAGLPVNAWTVDDPAELRRLAGLGIDGVFANDPARALEILAQPEG